MANNRLLLRCMVCAAELPIARLQVGMGTIWLPSRMAIEEYEQWLTQHSTCSEDEPGLHVILVGENAEALYLAS